MKMKIEDKLSDGLFFDTRKITPQTNWSIKILEFYNNVAKIMSKNYLPVEEFQFSPLGESESSETSSNSGV